MSGLAREDPAPDPSSADGGFGMTSAAPITSGSGLRAQAESPSGSEGISGMPGISLPGGPRQSDSVKDQLAVLNTGPALWGEGLTPHLALSF